MGVGTKIQLILRHIVFMTALHTCVEFVPKKLYVCADSGHEGGGQMRGGVVPSGLVVVVTRWLVVESGPTGGFGL